MLQTGKLLHIEDPMTLAGETEHDLLTAPPKPVPIGGRETKDIHRHTLFLDACLLFRLILALRNFNR
jgi:hypothetical protein